MHYKIPLVSVYCVLLNESPAYSESVLFTSSLLSPQDEYASTPLMAASDENHIEVARFLVECGASIDYQNKVFDIHFLFSNLLIMLHFCIPPQNGYSSLQVACDSGNTDIVKLLIQSCPNANIELKNKVGFVFK